MTKETFDKYVNWLNELDVIRQYLYQECREYLEQHPEVWNEE